MRAELPQPPDRSPSARTAEKTRSASLAAVLLASLAVTGGCMTAGPTPPPALDGSGASNMARSLQDAGLRSFLTRNLGRDPGPANAGTWDLNTLTWVAFYFHPDLAVARAQWEAARAAQSTASARPNPTLTLTPGFNSNAGVDSPWFPAIAADIPLETGGKRAARTDAAKLGTEAARQDLFAAAWKIRRELRQALTDFQTAGQRFFLSKPQVETRESILALIEQRRQAGTATALDVAAARISLLEAQASLAEAGRQIPIARQRFAEALGMPVSGLDGWSLPLQTSPTVLSPAALTAARAVSLRSRADVLAALARYDSTRASFTAEAAKRYPDLHFGPSYQWDQGASKWSLGVTLELPVFNRNEGPLAEALAKTRLAAADFNATQARVIAEIDRAAAAQAGADAVTASLTAIQSEIVLSRRQLMARRAAGGADQLDAANNMLEFVAAGLALFDAQTQAVAAAGQLEDALQVPFADLAPLLTVNVEKSP